MDKFVQVAVIFFIVVGAGYMLNLRFGWWKPFVEWVRDKVTK